MKTPLFKKIYCLSLIANLAAPVVCQAWDGVGTAAVGVGSLGAIGVGVAQVRGAEIADQADRLRSQAESLNARAKAKTLPSEESGGKTVFRSQYDHPGEWEYRNPQDYFDSINGDAPKPGEAAQLAENLRKLDPKSTVSVRIKRVDTITTLENFGNWTDKLDFRSNQFNFATDTFKGTPEEVAQFIAKNAHGREVVEVYVSHSLIRQPNAADLAAAEKMRADAKALVSKASQLEKGPEMVSLGRIRRGGMTALAGGMSVLAVRKVIADSVANGAQACREEMARRGSAENQVDEMAGIISQSQQASPVGQAERVSCLARSDAQPNRSPALAPSGSQGAVENQSASSGALN